MARLDIDVIDHARLEISRSFPGLIQGPHRQRHLEVERKCELVEKLDLLRVMSSGVSTPYYSLNRPCKLNQASACSYYTC